MSARGMFRRGSRISSPIIDALSTPVTENAIVDQKIISLMCTLGTNADGASDVADPYRPQITTLSTMSSIAGTHRPTAPALCTHFPILRPATLGPTASARPINEAPIAYAGIVARCAPRAPVSTAALITVNKSSDGKYGRFDVQYSHPVRNPANPPNARLFQT